MEVTSIIIIALLVLLVIAVVVLATKKNKVTNPQEVVIPQEILTKQSNLETENGILKGTISEKDRNIQELNDIIISLREQKETLSTENTSLKTKADFSQKAAQDIKDQHAESIRRHREEIIGKDKELTDLKQKNEVLFSELSDCKAQLEGAKTNYINLEKNFNEYKANFEQLQKQFEERIKNVTNDILEEKTKKFSEQNNESLSNILKPFQENIKEFKDKVEKNINEQTGLSSSLKEQIKNVMEQSKQISKEANDLASALKGENKRAGNWGEHVLETILQNSGLIKGQNYFTQESINIETEDGKTKRYIPDCIVKVPGSEDESDSIIIDSKVSLVAYERYFHAESEEDRAIALKEHITSIRSHIKELANKDYEKLTKGDINFVMMFVPIEPAYILAMQNEPGLWEEAYKQKIVLISATNMISSLRLIADLWKLNTRNANAKNIAEEASKMYDKFIGFLENFKKIEDHLKKAQESFSDAKGQLNTGRGNLIGKMEQLKNMGIESKKQLPNGFENYDD
ncbi:MAG: DNA recombination protein RmuC [Bacteroidales bacterium]|nr:DNA recombination protein RmuC [Candidatus Scybalousia scybalohippi]